MRSESPPATQSTWEPPVSPLGLLEEQLYHSPWKLLLACMLLNRTNANQVRTDAPQTRYLLRCAHGGDPGSSVRACAFDASSCLLFD